MDVLIMSDLSGTAEISYKTDLVLQEHSMRSDFDDWLSWPHVMLNQSSGFEIRQGTVFAYTKARNRVNCIKTLLEDIWRKSSNKSRNGFRLR